MNHKLHKQWRKLMDKALIEVGATKNLVDEAHISENGCKIPSKYIYILDTKCGKLNMIIEEPYRILKGTRLDYDCTIFARFEDVEAAKQVLAGDIRLNKYSGKWNFHYGPQTEENLTYVVNNVILYLTKLLN